MKWKQRKTINTVPDIRGCGGNLYTSYTDILKEIYDRERAGRSRDYEDLTMEEKLLVDADMEFLKDEYDGTYLTGLSQYTLERCLARLRKRDRENGK